MTDTIFTLPNTGPGKGVTRDRWGRPLIIPPDGGSPIAYKRPTTIAGVLGDKNNLIAWKARMTALGLAQRPDLLLAVDAHKDDTTVTELNKIVEQAADHAGASLRRDLGTELHALTERADRGEILTTIPAPYDKDIAAYQAECARIGAQPVEIEQFVVNDDIQAAGTFDRVYDMGGYRVIGDLKTGRTLDFSAGDYAIQLAIYAHSTPYDVQTGQRGAPLDVSLDRAIIMHLPAGSNTCTAYWVDIRRGWESLQLALAVTDWRKLRKQQWLTAVEDSSSVDDPILWAIALATSGSMLTSIWKRYSADWGEKHTQAAARKLNDLTQQ